MINNKNARLSWPPRIYDARSILFAFVLATTGCPHDKGQAKVEHVEHKDDHSQKGHGHEHGGHDELEGHKGHKGHEDHEDNHDDHKAGHAKKHEGHDAPKKKAGSEHDGHDGHEEGVVEFSPEALKRAKIKVTKAKLRALPSVINTTGEVAFDQDRVAHVSPRISGRVHRVFAKLGDEVKAQQSLALIDSVEVGRAKASYLQARAQLALARKNLSREEKLLKDKIASAKDVLNARTAQQKANADYRAARQHLRLLGLGGINRLQYGKGGTALVGVRSAIAGRIIKKHVTLGELVKPDNNLFTVADLSSVWVWIDVYERDLAGVHLEDKVQVQVRAYPKRVYKGEVAYISDQVDRNTRAIRARLDVKNTDGTLKPGMFAEVRISDPHAKDGKGARRSALAVPASSMQRQGKERIAFVKLSERRFVRREVVLGVETDGFVEIRSGIELGENVVSQGAFILKSELAKESMGGGHSH
jgi:membrane fusion protein, heavy metal efflux system